MVRAEYATKKGTIMAKAALIVGAGDATGGAIARAFAAEGFSLCQPPRT